jgi:hypothetical protein
MQEDKAFFHKMNTWTSHHARENGCADKEQNNVNR